MYESLLNDQVRLLEMLVLGEPLEEVLGTFAIYYRQPCKPDPDHLHLIGLVTHIAGIAIHCRRAEEKKRQVFERISDGFVALDTQWRYTYVNPKAGQIFGREPASLIGKHIWTEFPEAAAQPIRGVCEKAMAAQTPTILEAYCQPHGKWFENRLADPELKRFATSIVRAADRSGDLTRKLLAFPGKGISKPYPSMCTR